MTRRQAVLAIVAPIAAVLLIGRVIAGVYVEYRWVAALDAAEIWRARAFNLTLIRPLSGMVGSLFVFLNLFAVRQSIEELILPRRVGNIEIPEAVPGRRLTIVVFALAAAIGISLALALDDWTVVALARHGR